jgi:hypothetical protein
MAIFTKAQLEETIKYEVDMLTHAYHKVQTQSGIADRNMALECFLLHSRNLRDFMLGDRKKKHDIIAADVNDIDSAMWKPIIHAYRKQNKDIVKEMEAISKHMAHITDSRHTGPPSPTGPQEWEVGKIYKFLMELVKEFNEKAGLGLDLSEHLKEISATYINCSSMTGPTETPGI